MHKWTWGIKGTFGTLLVACLVSCSVVKPPVRTFEKQPCRSGGVCDVQVVIDGCTPVANDVSVNKDGGTIQIRWTAPPGYVFTEAGIQFSGESPVIDPHPGIQDQGSRWMVVDRPNGRKIESKYRIQVRSTSILPITCTGPDPMIFNE